MKKSKWKKPQLVILARSKPEEAILAGCKNPGWKEEMAQGGQIAKYRAGDT